MPSSTEHTQTLTPAPSAASALLDKIEQLSLLRMLNDRLAYASDFATACQALVELLWQEIAVECAAYVSVDVQRRAARLEAIAPASARGALPRAIGFETSPLPALLHTREPVVLPGDAAASLGVVAGTRGNGTALVSAPTRLRGTTTGFILCIERADDAALEETRRLLAVIAMAAGLALDAARTQVREEFLATLRHDIANPIDAALGYTEMMTERLTQRGERDLLPIVASMVESLKAVADLAANYLHMAAIDRGVPWLYQQDFDLGALAAEIVDRLRPSAADKQIRLEFRGSCPSAYGDRCQIDRVITNLVGNAIKYTPGGGRVEVTVVSDPSGATIAVDDTGYGLAPADVDNLFTKYGRFHTDTGIPGTGLGLYICKAVVEAHGGTIAIASTPGRGSTFTVHLPRRPV